MVVIASDGPSPHSPSMRLGLPAPQPLRRHHAESLRGPSFHDPRTHHVLESHPEQAAPLSRRDDERCHTIGSHSVLALRLYLAAYNTLRRMCKKNIKSLKKNAQENHQITQKTKNRQGTSRP